MYFFVGSVATVGADARATVGAATSLGVALVVYAALARVECVNHTRVISSAASLIFPSGLAVVQTASKQ